MKKSFISSQEFDPFHAKTEEVLVNQYINLFVASKNETTNYPIQEFEVLHKGQSLLKPLFYLLL